MILDKEIIENLIRNIKQELNIFPSHNFQYPIEINAENGNNLESILNFTYSYFQNLLKIENEKDEKISKHFEDQDTNKNDIEKGLS